MRAELFRPDAPDEVLAVLVWDGDRAVIERGADLPGITAILRPTPVQVDDPALRRPGTSGSSVLTPGNLGWFRAAVSTRAAALGYGVRLATGPIVGGWDPASAYREFEDRSRAVGTP